MFISKNVIDNPTQLPSDVDLVLYERAIKHYNHFDENNLWYVDEDRSCSHVFFDGEYCIEISPKYVRFLSDVDCNEFQSVTVNGKPMVRYRRSLKPAIYHPRVVRGAVDMEVRNPTPSETLLFAQHPELAEYCLYNRGCGWTIDMCNNHYPVAPGVSASYHAVKVARWFKETHNIIGVVSKSYRRRVCSVKFVVA